MSKDQVIEEITKGRNYCLLGFGVTLIIGFLVGWTKYQSYIVSFMMLFGGGYISLDEAIKLIKRIE